MGIFIRLHTEPVGCMSLGLSKVFTRDNNDRKRFSYFRYHFMGLITFEYIPVWYLASILCETFVIRNAMVAAWVKAEEMKEE